MNTKVGRNGRVQRKHYLLVEPTRRELIIEALSMHYSPFLLMLSMLGLWAYSRS